MRRVTRQPRLVQRVFFRPPTRAAHGRRQPAGRRPGRGDRAVQRSFVTVGHGRARAHGQRQFHALAQVQAQAAPADVAPAWLDWIHAAFVGRAVSRAGRRWLADRGRVERLDAQEPRARVRPSWPGAARFAPDGREVDHRAAGAKMDQADLVLAALDAAIEPVAAARPAGKSTMRRKRWSISRVRGIGRALAGTGVSRARATRPPALSSRASCRWAPAGRAVPAVPGSTAGCTARGQTRRTRCPT